MNWGFLQHMIWSNCLRYLCIPHPGRYRVYPEPKRSESRRVY